MSAAPSEDGIRFERRGDLGIVVLDRPKALNALSHGMVRAMSRQLALWKDDEAVGGVLVQAVPGRAFCSGGDVRAASEAWRGGGAAAAMPFFWDEYRLNWRIRTYPKPYIALMDGLTMGGGVGISVHGARRIATEATVLAMPETAIGMFPDVGATFFLGRCVPLPLGMFLGLTGARLDAAGCVAAGVAQAQVASASMPGLAEALAALPLVDALGSGARLARIDGVIASFAGAPGSDPLAAGRQRLDVCFGAATIGELLARLDQDRSGWGVETMAALRRCSPFAVRLTFEQLRRAPLLGFEQAMAMEYRMVHRVFAQGDFHEGVRALLIDKDRRPRWAHDAIEDVPDGLVETCFVPLPEPADELVLDWRLD